jgi:hypothetical protein
VGSQTLFKRVLLNRPLQAIASQQNRQTRECKTRFHTASAVLGLIINGPSSTR